MAGAGRHLVVDVSTRMNHAKAHLPGACWLLRSRLSDAMAQLPPAARVVVTCETGRLASLVAHELSLAADWQVAVLEGACPPGAQPACRWRRVKRGC
jgi:hypothetical protein